MNSRQFITLTSGNWQSKNTSISLLNDLESIAFTVSYDTSIEFGSLGHCTHLTQKALRCFAPSGFPKSQHYKDYSIHTIFMARESSEWDTHKPLFSIVNNHMIYTGSQIII